MQTVRVALAQIAPKLGDLESNLELHRNAIRLARREKAGVVVFPELSLTGYVLRDQVPEIALTRTSPLFRKPTSVQGVRSVNLSTSFSF